MIVVVLQALAILLSINLSGALHEIADVLVHPHHETAAPEDAQDDDGMDCPPGCPTCHSCGHAQVPYARAAAPILEPMVVLIDSPQPDTRRPPRCEPSSIERPPRVLSSRST